MTESQLSRVVFVDGPLDGHTQPISLGIRQLNDLVAIPINHNVVAKLKRPPLPPQPAEAATSIAVYTREPVSAPADSGEKTTYKYLGSALPSQFQMKDWRG